MYGSRPHRRSDYREPRLRSETLWRLPRARVVVSDQAALERDFPSLRAEAQALPTRMPGVPLHDRWLLHHAARISEAQAAQTTVNTPIEIAGPRVLGFRPPRYGRSAVVSTRTSLLDLKGVGVAPGVVPRPVAHGDGLLLLGEALEELAFQRLIASVFVHSGAQLSTVQTYAIIDAGFQVKTSDGSLAPAAIAVRRAHQRPLGGVELPQPRSTEEQVKLRVELLLRHYGITSCNIGTRTTLDVDARRFSLRYAGRLQRVEPAQQRRIRSALAGRTGRIELDGVNVQLTGETSRSGATLVDFGQYELRRRFARPLMNLRREPGPRWGVICWPDDERFVQPHPRLAVEPWSEDRASFSRWCSDLAADFTSRSIDGSEILRRLAELWNRARRRWS